MIFGGQPQDDWSPGEERVNRRWTHFFFAALLGNWLVLVWACAAEGKHVDVSGSGDDFICFPRLIFIGRNLNRDELQRGFQSTLSWRFCSLRFRGPCCYMVEFFCVNWKDVAPDVTHLLIMLESVYRNRMPGRTLHKHSNCSWQAEKKGRGMVSTCWKQVLIG